MARRPEVEARDLQKKLLRAQCEIDRRELQAEVLAIRQRVAALGRTIHRLRLAAPWVAGGVAAAGLLTGRRRGGLLSRLATGIGLARRVAPWVPALFQSFRRNPRRTPGAEARTGRTVGV
jgi:hypothetical protein